VVAVGKIRVEYLCESRLGESYQLRRLCYAAADYVYKRDYVYKPFMTCFNRWCGLELSDAPWPRVRRTGELQLSHL